MCVCAGIDVDIDVEHDGQRTKVTPPSKDGGVVDGANTEKDGANSEVGGASAAGAATEGSKVSESCFITYYLQDLKYKYKYLQCSSHPY